MDFLYHRELYAALQAALLRLWGAPGAPPLALLDLGCGDAAAVGGVLGRCGAPGGPLRLVSYTGVDLSAPALAIAATNLGFLQPGCAVNLLQV